jgi:hypothetical protein
MKNVLVVLSVVSVLGAAPALAEDVPDVTLSALGLGGMQSVSDVEGSQVRGGAVTLPHASSFGFVTGTSLVFGQLLTPDAKNFIVGSSTNEVDANADTTAAGGALTVNKTHSTTLDLNLSVTFPDLTTFTGVLGGIAGGTGMVNAIQP